MSEKKNERNLIVSDPNKEEVTPRGHQQRRQGPNLFWVGGGGEWNVTRKRSRGRPFTAFRFDPAKDAHLPYQKGLKKKRWGNPLEKRWWGQAKPKSLSPESFQRKSSNAPAL